MRAVPFTRSVRGDAGISAVQDLTVLFVAVVGFSLFFATLAGAYVAHQARSLSDRLQARADALLEAIMVDGRWTRERGVFLADGLNQATDRDVHALAAGHPSQVVVWDLATGVRWSFGGDPSGVHWRTASTAGNVVDGGGVHPARITATVWGA